jgi:hypothetical protein
MADQIQISNPSSGAQIPSTNLIDLVNALRPLFSIVPGASNPASNTIFAQSTLPVPSQQGGVWFRLSADATQQPMGCYWFSTYCNFWVRMWDIPIGGMAFLQDINPTLYFNMATGLGLLGAPNAPDHLATVACDWYGWKLHLANDVGALMDRFIVSANKYQVGLTPSGWQTMLLNGTLVNRGGRSGAPLTPPVVPSVPVTGFEYDSTVVVGGGGVAGATVSNGGSGFTSAPGVTFTGGGGSGATGTATVSGGSVTGISITNPGSGFTSAPAVGFTGGGGSGAAATATLTSAKIPQAIVSQKYSGAAQSSDGIISGVINPSQTALTDYPPFVALGLLEFIGYTYTDPTVPI